MERMGQVLRIPKIGLWGGFLCLIFGLMASSCTGTEGTVENREVCQSYNDSLFARLNHTRALFVYSMEEIGERKSVMDRRLKALKFVPGEDLSPEDRENANLYNAIFRIYRDLSERYAQAVVKAEEQFYTLKGLSKAIQAGKYDADRSAYKNEALQLETQMAENHAQALDITQRLKAVEPNYHRLVAPMDELAERLQLDAAASRAAE